MESIIIVLNENYHLWKRFYVEDDLERYFSFVTERVDGIGPYGSLQVEIVGTLFPKVMWNIKKKGGFK